VAALFYGEPGTGKTLTAEAIAGELNRPLLVASIPAVLSKWVGQTESNLARLFERAQKQEAVLFLDEADSLLMERGAGRASRHDDAAVNVLLELIERHDGVTLLATNRPERLDRALARRLAYRLQFALPGAEERAAIWRGLLPDTVPVEGALDFVALGRVFELSGALIKNAVFKAAFRVASRGGTLTQAALEQAAAEELESRVGVGLPATDFAGAALA
jgi:SpoVK/Ycf46/Vps4 family AAA+-type ATPase